MTADAAAAIARTGMHIAVGSRHCTPLPHTEGPEARTATARVATKRPVEAITHAWNYRLTRGVYRSFPTPVNVHAAQGRRAREPEGVTRGPRQTVGRLIWRAHPRRVF